MLTAHLFPELARFLIGEDRSLLFIPSGSGPQADRNERGALTIEPYRPCAMVMQRRTLVRALMVDWPEVDPLAVRSSLDGRSGFGVTHILDLAGLYIPGQASPLAAVFVGHYARPEFVRVLRGVRGEPRALENPAEGLVFRDLVSRWDSPGETRWSRVTDYRRGDGVTIAAMLSLRSAGEATHA